MLLPRPGWQLTSGRLAALVVFWALLVGAVVLELYPTLPRSAWGWALLVVAGPPIYVALEVLGSKLHGSTPGRRIAPAGFSWKRVLVALLVFLGIASLIVLATLL